MRILAVEDEPSIGRIIKNCLTRSGHVVDLIEDGIEAKDMIEIYDYDIAILDIMLPGMDGDKLCKHIRDLHLNTKIMMLTAMDDIDSKVTCLNMGADDYLTKPFSLDELDARVRALGRRGKMTSMTHLEQPPLELDPATRRVTVNGKPFKTTLTEFKLLEYLIRNKNRFCTKTMLLENVWGGKESQSNTITATISNLKSKIKKLNKGDGMICSVPKSGYTIN